MERLVPKHLGCIIFIFSKLSLSTKILLSVGITLSLMLAPLFAWNVYSQKEEIEVLALQRANTALNMLESVHVNAMLYRAQTEDNDPATDTLNGTMEQFSVQSDALKLWLVMGQKIMDFQIANGQNEIEGPLDAIDKQSLETGQNISVFCQMGRCDIQSL